MNQEKHIKKMENAKEQVARKYLRELRIFAARNLIKICGGDMAAAVSALAKAYGHEYGEK